jgi:hypothetical protein
MLRSGADLVAAPPMLRSGTVAATIAVTSTPSNDRVMTGSVHASARRRA